MTQSRLRTVLLLIYLLIIAVVPTLAFVLSKSFNASSSANNSSKTPSKVVTTVTQPREVPASLPDTEVEDEPSSSPSPSPTVNLVIGPTLSLKVRFEGRPANNQAMKKLFVAIAQGDIPKNPEYLLQYNTEVSNTGEIEGLSLAGLTPGTTYTAFIKGEAQISTASAFLMRPNQTILNNNQAIELTTGDLNDDNTINTADLNLLRQALYAKPSDTKWYARADFNLDDIINLLDQALIVKNLNRSGVNGPWQSTTAASSSAQLNAGSVVSESTPQPNFQTINSFKQLIEAQISPATPMPTPTPITTPMPTESSGYWMWVPKY